MQLQPSSVWLREEYTGGMAFFPDATNITFDLPTNEMPLTLVVEGQEAPAAAPPSPTANFVVTPRPGSIVVGPSGVTAETTPSNRAKTGKQTCNVVVVCTHFKCLAGGKANFKLVSQKFVLVTEESANVDYILSKVASWGRNHILVMANSLKIEDGSETRVV